jgi:hypothetical protein
VLLGPFYITGFVAGFIKPPVNNLASRHHNPDSTEPLAQGWFLIRNLTGSSSTDDFIFCNLTGDEDRFTINFVMKHQKSFPLPEMARPS